jgi:aspartyl-tRNA(Asn)/glutamyl-tRNA(Gln) amidotransferase subunit A
VLPLAPSLDAVGPMARRVLDVSLLLRLLAGHDPRDPFSLDAGLPDYPRAATAELTGLRIGIPVNPLWVDVDRQIAEVCQTGLRVFTSRGAQLVEVPAPPSTSQLLAPSWNCYDTVCAAEARHAHRDLLAHPDRYTPQVLARLRRGEGVTAVDYIEAQRLRRVWAEQWRDLFSTYRLAAVAHPTTDAPPPLVDPHEPPTGPAIRLSIPWSLARFPALSVPAGLDIRGLPVGLSLASLPEREAELIGLGAVLDEEIAFWRRTPPSRADPHHGLTAL